MQAASSPVVIAIVGGGAFATYALERLAARLHRAALTKPVRIVVFDKHGRFGGGYAHDKTQSQTSYMNRVAAQIAFAADESNVDALDLLPRTWRPSFYEWAQVKFRATGDERYDIGPEQAPPRYLHGEALREAFDRYIALLSKHPMVQVEVHDAEVTDIRREAAGTFRLTASGRCDEIFIVHRILLVTGHSVNRPDAVTGSYAEHAQRSGSGAYVHHVYPLRTTLDEKQITADRRVGVLGMGLTAIDVLLALTEGRGGTFAPVDAADPHSSLIYRCSGREPRTIVAFAPSGLFTHTRAENTKAAESQRLRRTERSHEAVFLTRAAVLSLRQRHGASTAFADEVVRQLDFDRHIFPLLILEMAWVYYTVLLGERFGARVRAATLDRYEFFLLRGASSPDDAVATLLEPVQAYFHEVAGAISKATDTAAIHALPADVADCRAAFHRVIFGESGVGGKSPWGHSPDLAAHVFDWRGLFDPLADTAGDWQVAVTRWLAGDLRAAAQGNLHNPVKAACDAVWRDLRSVWSEILDFGGLTASSQRRFMQTFFRHYTRMSNGAVPTSMRKVYALIAQGVVDVSIGPDPAVELATSGGTFRVRGSRSGAVRDLDILINGRTHPFDLELDTNSLYGNMQRHGLLRRWKNPGLEGDAPYIPGVLDLSRALHPRDVNGQKVPELTIMGPPTEGLLHFQFSAARPQSNSTLLANFCRWANELLASLALVDTSSHERALRPAPEGIHAS